MIELDLYINWGNVPMLTVLILPIYEYEISLFFIEVQLTENVLISAVQTSNSAIHSFLRIQRSASIYLEHH